MTYKEKGAFIHLLKCLGYKSSTHPMRWESNFYRSPYKKVEPLEIYVYDSYKEGDEGKCLVSPYTPAILRTYKEALEIIKDSWGEDKITAALVAMKLMQ